MRTTWRFWPLCQQIQPNRRARYSRNECFSWWRSVPISVYFSLEGADIFSTLFFCFFRTGHSKVVQAALLIDILIHPGHSRQIYVSEHWCTPLKPLLAPLASVAHRICKSGVWYLSGWLTTLQSGHWKNMTSVLHQAKMLAYLRNTNVFFVNFFECSSCNLHSFPSLTSLVGWMHWRLWC